VEGLDQKLREEIGDVERMLKAMIKSLESKHLDPNTLNRKQFHDVLGLSIFGIFTTEARKAHQTCSKEHEGNGFG
jgi:hypothetical protein